jgi:hypothetical protein
MRHNEALSITCRVNRQFTYHVHTLQSSFAAPRLVPASLRHTIVVAISLSSPYAIRTKRLSMQRSQTLEGRDAEAPCAERVVP